MNLAHALIYVDRRHVPRRIFLAHCPRTMPSTTDHGLCEQSDQGFKML
jgi:hypothetical protein